MRRLGFRRGLPVLMTFVHLAFVWSVRPSQPHASRAEEIFLEFTPVSYQEGDGVPVFVPMEPPPLMPIQKMALILELPAMFLATLVGDLLLHRIEAWMYLSIPLVLLVWYVIGRWLDGLLGYIVPLHVPGMLRRLLIIAGMFVFFVSVSGLTPLYHHRTADSYWVLTGLMLWSSLCLAMMFSSSARKSGE